MKRKHVFQVRLSDEERFLIFNLAEREGLTAAEFTRLAIHEAANTRGIPSVGMTKYPTLVELSTSREIQNGK
jgi:hypothetical protein